MKTRAPFLFLCLLFTVFFIGTAACAEEFVCGDYTYQLINDTDAVITVFDGNGRNPVVIPDTLDGYTVVALGESLFDGYALLPSVTLPDTLLSIGKYAFRDCKNLTEIQLPDTLEAIDDLAFANCTELTAIALPDSLVEMGADPFHYCPSLTEINLAEEHPVFRFEDGVLFSIPDKRLIHIPFRTEWTAYTVPEGTEIIDDYAFYSAEPTTFYLPASLKKIGANAFSRCANLSRIQLPEGLESLGNSAFYACLELQSVTLPASLTDVGANPFRMCTSLTYLELSEGNTALTFEDGVLIDTQQKRLISYLNTSSAVDYCIPEGIEVIGDYAFGNDRISTITVPESVTGFGAGAFMNCHSLTSINVPAGLTYIGESCFSGCASLETLQLPNGITEIPKEAFARSGLISLVIPDSVTAIGHSAFSCCQSLAALTLPDGCTSIDAWAFERCSALTDLTIPASTTDLNLSAFWNCDAMTLHVQPDSPAAAFAENWGIPYTLAE